MTAAREEVQQRAARKLTEGSVKIIEEGRVAVRTENPDLAEKERQEQRTFREPPRPAAPVRGPAFRQVDAEARKLRAAHPDKYSTDELARTGVREHNPALKRREQDEERETLASNKRTRLQRHTERARTQADVKAEPRASTASAKTFTADEFAAHVRASMRRGIDSAIAVRQACEFFAN